MPENAFDIFDKFSQSARSVLINAEQIARSMDKKVSSEHILLSLSSTKGTLSYDILKDNMVSADQIRLVLDAKPSSKGNIQGLASDGKTILKKSVLFAATYKHISIDPEHILMSCLSNEKLQSYKVVVELGASPLKIKKQLSNLFADLSEMDKMIREKISHPTESSLEGFMSQLNHSTSKSHSKTPAIDAYTTDLTKAAKNRKLDSVIGRQKEIDRAIRILLRRTKNNPVLTGDPGVGKTAIAEAIAQIISCGKVPAALANTRILSLDLPQIVAGTVYRGQFEERIKKLINEVISEKNVILFIDEIHNIVGAGSAEGSIDAANIIKPSLAKGSVRVIGATTHEEYRKSIEKDSALERRFQKVIVNEPNIEDAIIMLKGIKHKYEKFHNVEITEDAIIAACEYSTRYIHDRNLPDKAIDLIDEAAAVASMSVINTASNSKDTIKTLSQKKEDAIKNEKFRLATILDNKIKKLKKEKNQTSFGFKKQLIDRNGIANIVEQWTGIPVSNFAPHDKHIFSNIEKKLNNKIIGQKDAIAEIVNALKRDQFGLTDEGKPIGSYMFLGPTGVGKTSLAREIAHNIFGEAKALIKIDMSEFMEKHNISRLIGAPPGYIGFEEAGKLTEAVRKQPYSVVLFDEIEKAHPDVFNMLLQIMEDGFLTDAQGRRVTFRHTLIIMTSNIGTKNITGKDIGFSSKSWGESFENIKDKLTNSLHQQVSPEFINRLDGIIIFRPLGVNDLTAISKKEISSLVARLAKNNKIYVKIDSDVIDFIAKTGLNNKFGARPIRRAIQYFIEDKIADYIINHPEEHKLCITLNNNTINVELSKSKAHGAK